MSAKGMSRVVPVAVTAVVTLAALPAVARGASTSASPSAVQQCPVTSTDDRTAVGLPGAGRGRGAIEVTSGQVTTVLVPGASGVPVLSAGSRFGASSAWADVDGDGCRDLLVGAPGLTVGGHKGAGGVVVVLDDVAGDLTAVGTITQDSAAGLGSPTAGAAFGTAIARADDNCIEIGAPGANVARTGSAPLKQAGEVVSLNLSGGSTSAVRCGLGLRTMLHPQAGAHYGAMVGTYAVGAPDAGHGNQTGTGYVEVGGLGYYGSAAGAHLGVSVAVTPHRGDESVNVMVGAPGQRVGGKAGAGAVVQFPYTPESTNRIRHRGPTLSQASPGIPGKVRAHARFGASLSSVVLEQRLPAVAERGVLVVGIPGATVAGNAGAGAVAVRTMTLPIPSNASPHWTLVSLASAGVPGRARASAHFGAATATAPGAIGLSQAWIYVGAPDDSADRGLVERFRLDWPGRLAAPEVMRRAGGASEGDRFGAALSGLEPSD